MRDAYREFAERGVRLVVIGNGQPEHARDFRQSQNVPFDLWVDPQMKAYQAAGLRRGLWQNFSVRSPAHLWRALRKGFRQGRVRGDPWQLGGALVITPGAELIYRQVSQEAGDHVAVGELLAAIDRR